MMSVVVGRSLVARVVGVRSPRRASLSSLTEVVHESSVWRAKREWQPTMREVPSALQQDLLLEASLLREWPPRVQQEHRRAATEEVRRADEARWRAYERQLELEEESLAKACEEYRRLVEDLVSLGRGANLKPVQALLVRWYEPLVRAIAAERVASHAGDAVEDRRAYGPLLLLLPPEQLAVIAMHETIGESLKYGLDGARFTRIVAAIGDSVQAEARVLLAKRRAQAISAAEGEAAGRRAFDPTTILRGMNPRLVGVRARKALEDDAGDWSPATRVKLGSFLLGEVLGVAVDEAGSPMLSHEMRAFRPNRQVGVVRPSESLLALACGSDLVRRAALPRYLPMLVEPAPWRAYDRGGFLRLGAPCMRTHGCKVQVEAVRRGEMPEVFAGLDALGKVAWRINRDLYDVVERCWADAMDLPDMPARRDVPVPPEPADDDEEAHRAWRRRCRKIERRNAEAHALKCDLILKLGIAEKFLDEPRFYFPYNLDFRGRAYPIPPNLNHLGSDLCRSLLFFADPKPLGERGLYWLRVHLANLFGKSKESLAARVAFSECHAADILRAADAPLEHRWWLEADEPWQALATCKEIAKASRYPGGPEAYPCALPVHADGSCNGLQHYASLGRDEEGGRQVNLLPGEEPRDVYSGVCALVADKVRADASADVETALPFGGGEKKTRRLATRAVEDFEDQIDDEEEEEEEEEADRVREALERRRLARVVDGLINRKVVKQTVMTSVYGVTFVGARQQIKDRIQDRLEAIIEAPPSAERDADIARLVRLGALDPETNEIDDATVYFCSSYVARLTLEVLAELFTSARHIMDWLSQCARLIAYEGQPVSFVTPLGLPVVQPYRRDASHAVRTLAQVVILVDHSDALPVSVSKQKSAFPPNFVHSLDSTHMLMTAIEMDRRGLAFTAVHDSYWTHAADVDVMNTTLRRCYFDLYSEPILEQLLESFQLRYPDVDFPPLPPRGTLDISRVLESAYFFS